MTREAELGHFNKLQFIPTLEQQMHTRLPDLSASNAREEILGLMQQHNIVIPERATLPSLLDALCGKFIEPLCDDPTFITHHPAALSPLAKTFTCPQTGQQISARAELFIQGREYANMYEEENSPSSSVRSLSSNWRIDRLLNLGSRLRSTRATLRLWNGGFLRRVAGAWGSNRLVMLLSGHQRIGDVLPFGTLRNVVGLQRVDKRREKQS
ncbi:hypothetical protein MRB53_041444 [Persea americana]|nr:hypothetical protein MRB53_041444 [Persea americana]